MPDISQPPDPISQALDNADWWWRDCADRALTHCCESGREFTADDLRELGVPEPDHPNRWGALFAGAHARGVIEPVRFSTSSRRARHGGTYRVWRGAWQGVHTVQTPAGGRSRSTSDGPRELSAWFRQTVAARLATIDALGLPDAIAVVVPLSGTTTIPGSDDDRTCDRCGAYVPDDQQFHFTYLRPRPNVTVFGGLCTGCRDRERGWSAA